MADAHTARPSPGERGHTLVEILVGLTLTVTLMAATLTLVMSSRRTFDHDRERTTSRRAYHGALSIVGADVREAGRWLPVDVPAVEIVDGGGAGDELIIRRAVFGEPLRLCADVAAGAVDTDVTVVNGSSPLRGCRPVGDLDGDGIADDVERWRAARALAPGGALTVYLYNPATGIGESFLFDSDGSTATTIARGDGGGWSAAHLATQRPRLFLLEEVRYRVTGGVPDARGDRSRGTVAGHGRCRIVRRRRRTRRRFARRDLERDRALVEPRFGRRRTGRDSGRCPLPHRDLLHVRSERGARRMSVIRSRPRATEDGFALVAVLMLLALLMSLGFAYFTLTQVEVRSTRATSRSLRGMYAAEAGLNWRGATLTTLLNGGGTPGGAAPTATMPCAGSNVGSGDLGCSSLTLDGREIRTWVTPAGGTRRVRIGRGEPFGDLVAEEIGWSVEADALDEGARHMAGMRMHLRRQALPVFQFAAYWDKDLEFEAPLNLAGPVYTSGGSVPGASGRNPALRRSGRGLGRPGDRAQACRQLPGRGALGREPRGRRRASRLQLGAPASERQRHDRLARDGAGRRRRSATAGSRRAARRAERLLLESRGPADRARHGDRGGPGAPGGRERRHGGVD